MNEMLFSILFFNSVYLIDIVLGADFDKFEAPNGEMYVDHSFYFVLIYKNKIKLNSK